MPANPQVAQEMNALTAEDFVSMSDAEQKEFLDLFGEADPQAAVAWYDRTLPAVQKLEQASQSDIAENELARREQILGGPIALDEENIDYPGWGGQAEVGRIEEGPRALSTLRLRDPSTEFEQFDAPGGGYDLYYRPKGSRTWHRFNRAGPGVQDVPAIAGAMTTPGTAAEIAANIGASYVTGGMSAVAAIPARAALGGLAGAGGRALDEAVEPGDQTPQQIEEKAIESAAFGAGGSLAGDVIVGGARRVFGKPAEGTMSQTARNWVEMNRRIEDLNRSNPEVARITSEIESARAAGNQVLAARLEQELAANRIAPLTPGEAGVSSAEQAGRNFLRRGLDTDVMEFAANRYRAPRATLLSMAGNERVPEIPREQLEAFLKQDRVDALRDVRRALSREHNISRTDGPVAKEAGEAFDAGYRRVVQRLGDAGNAEWNAALNYARQGNFEFDISNFKRLVQLYRERPLYETYPDIKEFPRVQVDAGGAASLDPNLRAVRQGLPWAQAYERDFRQLFAKIDSFNEMQPSDRIDALEAIRRELAGVAETEAGLLASPYSKRVAADLLDSLTTSFAQAGDGRFGQLMDSARQFWREKSQFQRTFDMVLPPSQQDALYGTSVYRALMGQDRFGEFDGAKLLAENLTPEARDGFRSAFAADALRDPDKLDGLISNLGERAGSIIPDALIDSLRVWRDNMKKIDASSAARILRNTEEQFVEDVRLLDPRQEMLLRRLYSDGAITQDQLRGTFMTDLVERSSKEVDGVWQLDPQRYMTNLEAAKKTPAYELLRDDAKRHLDDVEAVASFAHRSNDMMAALSAGGMAQDFADPAKNFGAPAAMSAIERVRRAWMLRLFNSRRYLRYLGAEGEESRAATTSWRVARAAVRLAAIAFPRVAGERGTEQRSLVQRDPDTGVNTILVDSGVPQDAEETQMEQP